MKKSLLTLVFTVTMYCGFSQIWGDFDSRTEWRDNAGLQGNAGAKSGFFQTSNPVNYPPGASSWWHLLDVRHSSPENNYAMQFAGSFYDQNLYFRKTNDNPVQPWSKVVLQTPEGVVNLEGSNSYVYAAINFIDNGQNTSGRVKKWGIYAGRDGGTWNSGLGFLRYDAVNPCAGGICDVSMFLHDNGNIGIGTENPTTKLDVNGVIQVYNIDNKEAKWDNLQIWADGACSFIQSNGDENGLRIKSNTGNKILLESNVGIGTLYPTEKLSVDGNIRSRKVIVTQTGWPDYVFEPSYQLPSLNSVHNFIKENKHLPGMASAAVVEKEGLDLGEVVKQQQQKIEELMLYMIEQNKKIEQQQTIIETLNKRVEQFEKNK